MSIAIKPENRGKFTEYCGGKVTQEKIDKAKNSPDPSVRKMATFADNARHWAKKGEDGLKVEQPYSFQSWLISQHQPEQKQGQELPAYGAFYSFQDWLSGHKLPEPLTSPTVQQVSYPSIETVRAQNQNRLAGSYISQGVDYGKTADYIRNYLKTNLGLTDSQAEGFVINFWTESKFNPQAYNPGSDRTREDGTVVHYSGGDSGLCQWVGNRKRRFQQRYGKKVTDASLDEQLEYACWELKNLFPNTLREIRKTDNVIDAANVALLGFEATTDKPHISEDDYKQIYVHGRTESLLNRLRNVGYKI